MQLVIVQDFITKERRLCECCEERAYSMYAGKLLRYNADGESKLGYCLCDRICIKEQESEYKLMRELFDDLPLGTVEGEYLYYGFEEEEHDD